jgi:putative PIG3 family NAD(P)H quinone oxidoreductase
MRAIVVKDPGRDYQLTLEEVPTPRPGPGQVLLEVAAAGVNRADLLQARGAYPPPEGASALLGLECSGTVTEVGAQVVGWNPGDQAAGLLPGGGYAQYAVVEQGCLLPVPGSLPLEDAAAAPESVATVWSNLTEAGYTPGRSVLAHGGAGGIGTMATTLATALGSAVYTTAGSADRARACEDIGAAGAFDYNAGDFAEAVLDATGGRGVDFILDIVGGSYLEQNLRALTQGGTLIVIGLMGGSRAELDLGRLLNRRGRIMATNLRNRPQASKDGIVRRVLEEVWPLVTGGESAPVVGARLPMADAAEAHRLMKSGSVFGKIVLTWD